MPMVPFYSKYPDLAVNQTRTVTVYGRNDLPDGEYGFIELYCDEASCDCRRVIINVLTPTTGSEVWATINYGWESLAFYEKWMRNKELAEGCKGPTLDPLNPQGEYAPVLLRLFEYLLTDEKYVARLRRHYELFKKAIGEGNKSEGQGKYRSKKKRRRGR